MDTESNARARDAVAEREEAVLREIDAAGWLWSAARIWLDGEGFVESISGFGTCPDPRRPGVESLIFLHVSLRRGDVMGIEADAEAEDPGHGISISIGKGRIPTPEEAGEAYHAELRRLSGAPR